MEGRISITTVVVFWLITMTWLMWTKVLPPLLLGEPPNYAKIVDDHGETPKPSAWIISCDGKPFGVTANHLERKRQMSTIHSFVKIDRFPLEAIPVFFRSQVSQLGSSAFQAHSTLLIDSLGHMVDFDSRLLAGKSEMLRLRGVVQNGNMQVMVHSRLLPNQKPIDLPVDSNSLLGIQLSPQDRLPGLRIGQEWAVPVFSITNAIMNKKSMELARAHVEREELIFVGGQKVSVLLVIVGADTGAGDREEQSRMWVDQEGRVLRQELMFFGKKLRFERCNEKTSAEICEMFQRDAKRADLIAQQRKDLLVHRSNRTHRPTTSKTRPRGVVESVQ